MKNIFLIALMMLIFLVPLVHSEVFISGENVLVPDDDVFIQHVFVSYPETERVFFSTPIIDMKASIACEDLTEFNTNNPDNVIQNLTFKIKKLENQLSIVGGFQVFNNTFIEEQIDLILEVEAGDNPIINFFKRLFGIDVETRTIAFIDEREFTLKEGEFISFDLITLFANASGVVQDSSCRFDVSFDSINCEDCGRTSFEEAVKQIDTKQSTFATVSAIYGLMTTFVDLNFDLWTFFSWIIKIAVILGSIFFLVYSVFWLYFFLKRTFGRKREDELM